MPDSPPQLWVFAGPNGAGKSTLVARYLRDRQPVVNPDVIASDIGQDDLSSPAILEAGRIAIRQRFALVAGGHSFAIETTLSGNSEIRLMRDANNAGYKVNLVFVGVRSALLSQRRVDHRVSLGLHFVPPEDIVRRYPRSMENLAVAMRLANRSLLVDNTGEGFRLILIQRDGCTSTVAKKLPAWVIEAVPAELR
jgi:predicted ABC-type ATPase